MSLCLCRVLVALEDGPDRLLAGSVVCGNLQELVRGTRLLAPQFVDQGLAVHPAEERTDDVGVDDARQRVALLGEALVARCSRAGTHRAPA